MKPNQAVSMFRINCRFAEGQKGWRFIAAVFLALLSFSANPGLDLIFADGFEGCSSDSWLGGAVGAVVAMEPPGGVPQLEGECVLHATGTGHVQDISPSIHSRIRIRFYFLPALTSGSGYVKILSAYSDEGGTSSLFNIGFQGTDIVFDTSAAGGSSSPPIESSEEWWHLVEVDWDAVTGSSSIWVDKDATSAAPDAIVPSGFGFVESVKLGIPNGFDGFVGEIFFDAYESRNTTAIGPVPGTGDSDNDGLSDLDEYAAGTNPFDPDTDDDGIGDAYDRDPLDDSNAKCTTNNGTNATLVSAQVIADQTCASKESVDVNGDNGVLYTVVFGTEGNLLLISEKVIFKDTVVEVGARMEVINADPCPGCTPP